MNNCYECGRKFVKKVKDALKECICTRWLTGDKDEGKEHDALRFMCSECYHLQRRTQRIRDRAERELTPGKKRPKRKEKK